MKYQAQLAGVSQLLPQAKNILVALPTNFTVDELAAALALYLSLKQSGKEVSIVTEGVLTVNQSHLFGIGEIKNTLPQASGGNLVITFKGVVVPDTAGQPSVPSLWKVDWAPQGSDFNLTFHAMPGQSFNPTEILPHRSGGNFDLIFVIGAANLVEMGGIYNNQPPVFSSSHVVNIDRDLANTSFGQTNILDTGSSSMSEVVGQILSDIGLVLDRDGATNILVGIYGATANLQTGTTAETFEVIAQALKAGGTKPNQPIAVEQIVQVAQPATTSSAQTSPTPQTDSGAIFNQFISPQNFDLSKVFNPQSITTPSSGPEIAKDNTPPQPSAEEVPVGEEAVTPEDDWLVPKIYKGGSVG